MQNICKTALVAPLSDGVRLIEEFGCLGRKWKMSAQELIDSGLSVISRTQAAELLDCDPRTISKGIQDGEIPCITLGRRKMIPLMPFLRLLGIDAGRF